MTTSIVVDLASTLRDDYRARKGVIFENLRTGGAVRNVHTTLRALSALADHTLRALWDDAGFGKQFALIAVGGYGRGKLFPYSDVDVLLLLPDLLAEGTPENRATTERQVAQIEAFIGRCWDAGLEIASSVRTIDEFRIAIAGPLVSLAHFT